MKNNLKKYLALLALGLFMAGCNKDDDKPVPPPEPPKPPVEEMEETGETDTGATT